MPPRGPRATALLPRRVEAGIDARVTVGAAETTVEETIRLDVSNAALESIDFLLPAGLDVDAIDLRPVLEPLGLKPRKALQAIYTAIEGRHQGLPLFGCAVLSHGGNLVLESVRLL